MTVARSTTTRDRHRAQIRRSQPPCGICQGEIDYSLHWRDPLSFVVDHVIPLAQGGSDDITNKQAAHRHCNRIKSDQMPDEVVVDAPRTFVTSRKWS
jgi:5-methylcytosine-specific restriction endonuclease McrA